MAIEQTAISKYNDAARIIKLTQEEMVEEIAVQSFRAFNNQVYDKFIPLYQEANQITGKVTRQRRWQSLDRQFGAAVHTFHDRFEIETLKSLEKNVLQTSRLKNQFLQERDLRRPREPLREVESASKKRVLKLQGRNAKLTKRHTGDREHVIDKLAKGLARDAKQIGVDGGFTPRQYIRRTAGWNKTVARTQAQGAVADAEKTAIQEVFDKYQYVATEDEVTTTICSSINGNIYASDSADSPRPPLHFNCRSEVQPVPASKERRDALERVRKEKFKTWLGRQPENVQKQIVGPKLFDSYKSGAYVPPPRWNSQIRYTVDSKTGLPIVPNKTNQDRIERRLREVQVEFDPNINI